MAGISKDQIAAWYRQYLGRDPYPSEASYVNYWSKKGASAEQGIANSDEAKKRASQPAAPPPAAPAASGKSPAETAAEAANIAPNPQEMWQEWTVEQMDEAREYAESVYGPYFAELLQKAMDLSSTSIERQTEDTAMQIESLNNQLNDYLDKSEVEKSRIEQDFTTSRDSEMRNLGIDIEAIGTAKTREGADKDRLLAEYLTDYDTSGGRLSADKLQAIEQSDFANQMKGLTFSGQRIKDTGNIEEQARRQFEDLSTSYSRSVANTSTSYERNLADLERQETLRREESALTTEGLETAKERGLTDISTGAGIAQRDTEGQIERENLLKSRNISDIERALTEQQKQLRIDKAEEMEYGTKGGIRTQEDEAYANWARRFGQGEDTRVDSTRVYDYLKGTGYY